MSFNELKNKTYSNKLFTTPSHSQKYCITNKFRQFYKFDVSETDTHNTVSILNDAELHASKLYGVKQTKFLTNGSTSGIITAILSIVNDNDNVLVWGNAHQSHINAIKLAHANPIYYDLPINNFGVYAQDYNLEAYFIKNKIKVLLITSPSYEGYVADLPYLKALCKKYNTYFIVDEAHGALYPFSDKLPTSAIEYADIIVQSLHKTAGGLNPTALIHSNCDIDMTPALNCINTSSPSYPLLMSIENNINFLNSKKGRTEINKLISNIEIIKSNVNFDFGGDDPTKILIKKDGLTGYDISKNLFDYGIEDERTNAISTLLLTGIGTTEHKLKRLEKILNKI